MCIHKTVKVLLGAGRQGRWEVCYELVPKGHLAHLLPGLADRLVTLEEGHPLFASPCCSAPALWLLHVQPDHQRANLTESTPQHSHPSAGTRGQRTVSSLPNQGSREVQHHWLGPPFTTLELMCAVLPSIHFPLGALAGVAQRIERQPSNQRVAGSIPSLGHTPGLQARSPVGGA